MDTVSTVEKLLSFSQECLLLAEVLPIYLTNTCALIHSKGMPFITVTLIGTMSVDTLSNTTVVIAKSWVTLTTSIVHSTFINICYNNSACMYSIADHQVKSAQLYLPEHVALFKCRTYPSSRQEQLKLPLVLVQFWSQL